MDIAVLSLWNNELAPLVLSGYKGINYTTDTKDLLELYRLLRWIAEIPWLSKRGFNEAAKKDIDAVKRILNQ